MPDTVEANKKETERRSFQTPSIITILRVPSGLPDRSVVEELVLVYIYIYIITHIILRGTVIAVFILTHLP